MTGGAGGGHPECSPGAQPADSPGLGDGSKDLSSSAKSGDCEGEKVGVRTAPRARLQPPPRAWVGGPRAHRPRDRQREGHGPGQQVRAAVLRTGLVPACHGQVWKKGGLRTPCSQTSSQTRPWKDSVREKGREREDGQRGGAGRLGRGGTGNSCGSSPGVQGSRRTGARGLRRQEVGVGTGLSCGAGPPPLRGHRPSTGVGDGVGAGEGASASRSRGPRLLRPSWDLLRTIWARRASCSRDFILRAKGKRCWAGGWCGRGAGLGLPGPPGPHLAALQSARFSASRARRSAGDRARSGTCMDSSGL